ncbi:TetR/AcrR family transcriptional regulator [Lactococcus fujiensis]|uniref:TetR/AcrR family transcriptional regulator n=1 Tax=Lactococcus fujiensis TaxID=610251 RepID=UPI0020927EC2|nr:TetR/AcrR family transcriptional regulator [Lactococcus fujiensis]
MNNSITSKEILIHHCKEIVKAQGLKGISIRSLAEHSGVSIGAIYNYFSSKDQLVSETTGAIWQKYSIFLKRVSNMTNL